MLVAVPRTKPEKFDAGFYRRFYLDPKTRVVTRAEMARRADLVAAFVRHGDHVLVPDTVYGPTRRFAPVAPCH